MAYIDILQGVQYFFNKAIDNIYWEILEIINIYYI